jgi:hypothetical protein
MRWSAWWAFAALVGFFCSGCGAAAAAGSHAAGPGSLAPYAGRAAELFDDTIDPDAVGLATVTVDRRRDPALAERVNQSEAVARMRVSTVTVDTVGSQPTYHVSLLLVASLISKGYAPTRVELSLGPSSPAFGIVKWLDTGMIGRTFIGFFRRFAGTEEPALRFHLAADNSDVLAAVREAAALSDLKPLGSAP